MKVPESDCKEKLMATINSFAKLMLSWEKILSAFTDNAGALTTVEPQRAALEAFLAQARDLKGRHDSHRAAKQEIRQQLEQVIEGGREAARRLQGGVRGNLGTYNERLVQFNIAPLRPRGPRKRKPAPPPAQTPVPPEDTPIF
jgi:hypothetical protein